MRWLRRWSLLLALVAAQELVIGPSYTIDDAILDHGAPKSSRFEFWMPLVNSTSIFNGSDACLDPEKPPNATRHVIVDVPAAYVDGDAAPLLVMQDLGYGGETSLLGWVATRATASSGCPRSSSSHRERRRQRALARCDLRSPTGSGWSA